MMSTPILTTSHYGVVRFGDLAVEAVVLEDGTRGYVQRQLATRSRSRREIKACSASGARWYW